MLSAEEAKDAEDYWEFEHVVTWREVREAKDADHSEDGKDV